MEDEAMILWQDVLDEIMAGRTSNLRCPFCREGALSLTRGPRNTKIECPRCHKYIEGRFGEE
jgi:hypothetical protein